jgi:hypothetical protein
MRNRTSRAIVDVLTHHLVGRFVTSVNTISFKTELLVRTKDSYASYSPEMHPVSYRFPQSWLGFKAPTGSSSWGHRGL